MDHPKLTAFRLFGYSFLILFFELALIRFVPASVQVTAYFINLVLIAAFLGMGVGLILQLRQREITFLFAPAFLILIAACRYFSNIFVEVPFSGEEYLWSLKVISAPISKKWGMIPVVSLLFVLTTLVFLPLGSAVGREFGKFPPLVAYSINILGSLVGLGCFALLSYWSTPPFTWFLAGILLFLILTPQKRYVIVFLLCFPAALYLARGGVTGQNEMWSPYYRINYSQEGPITTVVVNGSLHQYMVKFPEPSEKDTKSFNHLVREDYLRPYQFVKKLDNVLILGAGTGNDVAIALEQNAQRIDAVEIDSRILDLGQRLHYEEPYKNPRVTRYVDDARAFLKKTDRKYDLIVLGTLDSQTLLSGMSSVRLDNYVYTQESFQAIKEHLAPGGVLILYHMSPTNVISFKIYNLLKQVFETPPLVNWQQSHRLFNFTYVAGAGNPVSKDFGFTFNLNPSEEERMETLFPAPTDDWPYLYLQSPSIPAFYFKVGGIIAAFSLVLVLLTLGRDHRGSPDGPLFFLGAGFLLLETKSVTEMSLLFGSTWQVNLLVFSSILALVLAANLIVLRFSEINVTRAFLFLFLSVALCFLFPVKSLLGLPLVGQWIVGGLLVALPLFFAGMVFAVLFKHRPQPVKSLGYNLIGAIMGGLLEYSSMALGTKSLYLVSLIMYLMAYLLHTRSSKLVLAPQG